MWEILNQKQQKERKKKKNEVGTLGAKIENESLWKKIRERLNSQT